MINVRNRGFEHCENTEQSIVLVCVFRGVRDCIEVWIDNEHRVTVHSSDLVELLGLLTGVEGGLGQKAKLLAARAEWRVSCAFGTEKHGKSCGLKRDAEVSVQEQQGWVRLETGEGEIERCHTRATNTFFMNLSHA